MPYSDFSGPIGDVVISVPLPHVDIEEDKLGPLKTAFHRDGHTLTLKAIDPYPVSASWAEVWFDIAAFTVAGIAAHYIDRVLDVFDAFVKRQFTELGLHVVVGNQGAYCNVQLKNREAARRAIADALFEIDIALNNREALIYNFRKAHFKEDGEIWFSTSDFRTGNYHSALKRIPTDSPDYDFFKWVIEHRRPDRLIADSDVEDLRTEFQQTKE